jgi:5-formyltetrahydrofolate cyclo-ligase
MTIAGYVTIGSELDCAPALAAFAGAGATVVLPVTAGQGIRLQFRVWKPGEALERGPFGTSHPTAGAAVAEPDTVLVPLLAFDGTGHRLGYGAGYYDRTLAALRLARPIRAIGLAFDGQEIPQVPADGTDQPLDAVITESRTLVFTSDLAN